MVGAREFGTGDARPDDDEALGQFAQVVDLLPGEDALVIGQGIGEGARAGSGCDENGVGGNTPVCVPGPGSRGECHLLGPGEPGQAAQDSDALADEPRFDVVALGVGELHDAGVHGGEVDGDRCIA